MLIPYRVRNPVKRFPIVTVCLIAINIIVYIFTSESYHFSIREDIVHQYAFHLGSLPVINAITSAFLHGDPFHLLGNMLFLWVFGPPVEDRMRIPRFLTLYFVTGLAGDLLQAGLDVSFIGATRPVIGASGSIMGILGAYWYLFSWSPVCIFYWIGWFWHGTTEIAAVWIIGLYLFMDLAQGLFFGSIGFSGGVASFAHVGGGFTGLFLCMAMRMKRDTEALSQAKALHADSRDIFNLPLHALEIMIEEDPGNPNLIRAIINPALRMHKQSAIDNAVAKAGPDLITKDPEIVYHYLVDLRGNHTIYRSVYLLRLAGMMERSGQPQKAMNVYRIVAGNLNDPEAETALYRIAHVAWNSFKDKDTARTCLNELEKRFPYGEMVSFGRILLKQLD